MRPALRTGTSCSAGRGTLLVRTDGPVHDPAWTITPVSMEELVLAYMNPANDIPARSPWLGVAS